MITKTIQENRDNFIRDLRENPLSLNQHQDCTLFNKDHWSACALGLGCFTLGIRFSANPYSHLQDLLDMSLEDLERVWQFNDTKDMSFMAISNELEKMWANKNGF